MPAEAILRTVLGEDISPRMVFSTTIAASPGGAAEVTIASLTVTANAAVMSGVVLVGWAAFTIGTAGVSCRLRIRQTGLTGTVVADTGVVTRGISAGALTNEDVMGVDTASALPGQVYVLTLAVGSATAASTVSSVFLDADVI
jgi:hypothetical protein